MTRKPLLLLASALIMMSCGKGSSTTDKHTAMRQAAQNYYTLLLEEKYDSLVLGIDAPDSLPIDYRSQLADAMAQYKIRETRGRQGLTGFRVVGDSLFPDSISGYTEIELTFGDQSHEQIIMPLVYVDGVWKMK